MLRQAQHLRVVRGQCGCLHEASATQGPHIWNCEPPFDQHLHPQYVRLYQRTECADGKVQEEEEATLCFRPTGQLGELTQRGLGYGLLPPKISCLSVCCPDHHEKIHEEEEEEEDKSE